MVNERAGAEEPCGAGRGAVPVARTSTHLHHPPPPPPPFLTYQADSWKGDDRLKPTKTQESLGKNERSGVEELWGPETSGPGTREHPAPPLAGGPWDDDLQEPAPLPPHCSLLTLPTTYTIYSLRAPSPAHHLPRLPPLPTSPAPPFPRPTLHAAVPHLAPLRWGLVAGAAREGRGPGVGGGAGAGEAAGQDGEMPAVPGEQATSTSSPPPALHTTCQVPHPR